MEKVELIKKIAEILESFGKPMNSKEIADDLKRRYPIDFPESNDQFKIKIQRLLFNVTHHIRNGKRIQDRSQLIKVSKKRGYYAFNSKIIEDIIPVKKVIKRKKKPTGMIDIFRKDPLFVTEKKIRNIIERYGALIDSNTFGTAGEYAVMSELMFRGFTANKTTVDNGIDILAIKDNKYFDIQVKSTVLKEDSTISHQIKLRSYDRHNRGGVFYIIVIRSTDKFTNKNYYLVFSTETINRYVQKNYMKASNEVISIKVYQEKGRLLLKNGVENEDITECINNFEIIK